MAADAGDDRRDLAGEIEAVRRSLEAEKAELKHLKTGRARARSYTRWELDCSAALIVGGATVALTLMLGGMAVAQDVFMALEVIYGLLLLLSALLTWRACVAIGGSIPLPAVLQLLLPGIGIVGLGASAASGGSHNWPIKPHTSQWWNFITLALVVAIIGVVRRHFSQDFLETSKD